MSEWYYSSAAYALFALSTCQVNVDESLFFHRTLAFSALMILSFVHLMHGLTNRAVSTWAFAFAYLLHFTTYGIFLFRGCVDHVWNVHKAWTTLASFWWNLPGLGQHYHHFDAISTGLGNIIIILMQSSYCSGNSTKFQTTLRGPSDCRVVWTIRRLHQKMIMLPKTFECYCSENIARTRNVVWNIGELSRTITSKWWW